MNDIAGIPYVEAEFDNNGNAKNQVTLPAGVTDLIVMSHGWNNDSAAARMLYQAFFTNFVAVAQPNDLPGRKFAIVGVIWPSKKFDELVAASGNAGSAQGSASIGGGGGQARMALETKIDSMKEIFTEPQQQKSLDEAKALLPDLEDKASARKEFADKIRALLDPGAANKEDAS